VITSAGSPTTLRAAHVLRAHGLRGEVRVEPCGGGVDRFTRGLQLLTENASAVLTVSSARPGTDGAVLLRFAEINDAAEAAKLRGEYLCVSIAAARPLADSEWFVWQLVGLRVITDAGEQLGEVVDVESAVGNDVLVVRGASAETRLPMVREFIKSVDVESGVITVTLWDEVEA
jgi:16S rRNA processing protein RimM